MRSKQLVKLYNGHTELRKGSMDQDMNLTPHKMWNRDATTILIQQYQQYECMWMTTSPFYRNKQKRTEALINIALVVSKYRPKTLAEDIKNKINGIRTQYVSEINKLISASNRGEQYEPTLWCFDMLAFLKPFTQPKQKSVAQNNSTWNRNFMPKMLRSQCPPAKPSRPQPSQPQELPQPSQSTETSDTKCIIIKEETEDNDIEIIEEDEDYNTNEDYSNHSSNVHEQEEPEEPESSTNPIHDEINIPNKEEIKYEEEKRIEKLLAPSGISAEITLVPKKSLLKRKCDDNENVLEEKKRKEVETNTENIELDNRINIFGRFVMSQMNIITDKVLLLKLEHTIQNAIIDAQLKQIELDEIKKNKHDQN